MKISILTALIYIACTNVFSGDVGLPVERLALPVVQGDHLVCIWDDTAGEWVGEFSAYDHAGTFDFLLPEWEKWYWVGLWDDQAGEYVFGKWIGHFQTH